MKSIVERIFKSNFIRNTGWIVFAQIYQMAVQLIIGVISARYLGPSNYGTINYAASYISFFTILCALGLEGIVVKEMVS
ncbi:MAG: oligosaccharide flippase family protein, partial [Oscillospiraceae bacterium]|nr:oligosaccharide flippase family protein [Oscillospiraceae bacterium]